jgi:PAS domain S-box-containing protein
MRRQTAAVAKLGRRALALGSLWALMNEAVTLLAENLDAEYVGVFQTVDGSDELLLGAGTGWGAGAVGSATVSSDSLFGQAMTSDDVVIFENLREETRFSGSTLLRDHEVASGMSAAIEGRELPYGVLGVYATESKVFTEHDGDFLRAVASVLAIALDSYRNEAALRGNEEHLRTTFEQAAAGFAHVSIDGRVLRANNSLCKIVGYPREELLEKTFREIVQPEDWDGVLEETRTLIAGDRGIHSAEVRCLRKDGSVVWAGLNVSLVRKRSGEPAYLVFVIEDINESKRAQEELRLLDRAVTASTNSITMTDPNQPDNPLVYVNPAFERTTGYSSEDVLGRNCRFLQADDRDQPALTELKTAIQGGRHCTVVLRNYRKDGTLFYNELSVYPVRDENGHVTNFVGVQNDVTERLRTEKARSEIRQAERRRIARDLHDIVLQDLSGALQSLRLVHLRAKNAGLELDLGEELEALGRASSGLRNAIYDLRHEKERPFVESVEALVELNRQATPERKIRLVISGEFSGRLTEEESVELLRVLQEALTNARRHSAARNVEVRLLTQDEECLIEVTDDGRGFDVASVPAGVGISGMRERVEGLGGTIEISSRPGKGTRVKLSVPLRGDTPTPRHL